MATEPLPEQVTTPDTGAMPGRGRAAVRGFWRGVLYAWLVLPLGGLFAYAVYGSREWRIVHDSPLMAYVAWLMDKHDMVPYRDIFDMNMLGTYVIHILIGRFLGYDDWGMRMGDLVFLGMIMVLVAVLLLRFGVLPAVMAALMVGLITLARGPNDMLQRDFIALAPVTLGLCCASVGAWRGGAVRGLLSGLCFGLAFTIKPHITLPGMFMLVYLVAEYARRGEGASRWLRDALRIAAATAFGFAVPILAMVGWLAAYGALNDFLDMAFGYLPYYGSLTSRHYTIGGADRVPYILRNMRAFGNNWFWTVAAVAGLFAALNHPRADARRRRLALLLGGLVLAYAVYPAFSGQFWKYHWIPLGFALTVCAGLAFSAYPARAALSREFVPVLLVVFLLLMHLHAEKGFAPLLRGPNRVPKAGRPDAIAQYLDRHLKPGETVQPMDWAGTGVAHGMLMAEAKLATPFLYHFHFYHHISAPYIQDLRKRFMKAFKEAKPRFVVEGHLPTAYARGEDTTRVFAESDRYLRENYTVVRDNRGFTIWERKKQRAEEEKNK